MTRVSQPTKLVQVPGRVFGDRLLARSHEGQLLLARRPPPAIQLALGDDLAISPSQLLTGSSQLDLVHVVPPLHLRQKTPAHDPRHEENTVPESVFEVARFPSFAGTPIPEAATRHVTAEERHAPLLGSRAKLDAVSSDEGELRAVARLPHAEPRPRISRHWRPLCRSR